MNKSVATINAPQFINLTPLDINPLMSSCEIKVLYVGENRNHSFITKEVATEMAKTLRGAPIVGYYKADKEDFADHGEVVIIDDEGIKFECKTVPYGFVSPDARVWFQEFEDTNAFGETVIREYLMTNGYLWTGQFEECRAAVEGDGKPQSMELDGETIQGHWETNTKGMDFFIINDAIFSKLCILGENVEPCFEGASVTAPNVSASFAKVDDTFKQTLYSMMQDLQFALKGGQQMDTNLDAVIDPVIEEPAPAIQEFEVQEPVIESEEPVAEPVIEDPVAASEPAAIDTPEVPEEPAAEPVLENALEPVAEEPVAEPAPVVEEPVVEPEPENNEYSLLQAQYEELQTNYSALQVELETLRGNYANLETSYNNLVEFKRQIDDAKKDQMIESFCMLSDEDKQDVIVNKAKYTVEEIEEKLSVICFRKGNFDLSNSSKNNNNTEKPIVTFNFNGTTGSAAKPAWLSAVDHVKNNNN